jgi:hypothetical protein
MMCPPARRKTKLPQVASASASLTGVRAPHWVATCNWVSSSTNPLVDVKETGQKMLFRCATLARQTGRICMHSPTNCMYSPNGESHHAPCGRAGKCMLNHPVNVSVPRFNVSMQVSSCRSGAPAHGGREGLTAWCSRQLALGPTTPIIQERVQRLGSPPLVDSLSRLDRHVTCCTPMMRRSGRLVVPTTQRDLEADCGSPCDITLYDRQKEESPRQRA